MTQPTAPTTILLIDQIRASRRIHETALANMEALKDEELAQALNGGSVASDSTLARLAAVASDSTLDRLAAVRTLVVPIVHDLDAKMYEAVENGELDMGSWHCETTHCRAGHAINFAGEAGYKLEAVVGSEMAGRMIYEASTGRIAPDFYARQDDAMADIRRCAGVSE